MQDDPKLYDPRPAPLEGAPETPEAARARALYERDHKPPDEPGLPPAFSPPQPQES